MKETRAKAERQVRRPLHKGKIYPFEYRVLGIARRDKKVFLSDQCKEIEENNRMGKTRDLFQRRQWQPIPVLLPGKSHGQRSLVGCSPWGL